ncbi:MAG: winged helix-turn-helix domain-containing protein [Vicinamibacterales bacterium]
MDHLASITLEPAARRLSLEGQPLDLTSLEFDILAYLVRAAGTVVDRERLMADVFARELHPDDRALDVHISRLRRKLGPHASLIVTIRGVGHMVKARA